MTQLCSQNNCCVCLNIADQSKIFIPLNLFYLENFLPLPVSMVHNLFKTCEKTSFSQVLLCHNISFYRILWLLFIASQISLKLNTVDFIASRSWPSHPLTFSLNLVCRSSHYFTFCCHQRALFAILFLKPHHSCSIFQITTLVPLLVQLRL